MGKFKVNEQDLVAPMPQMRVSEVKELALVPAKDKLYDQTGRVLRDDEVVSTEGTRLGAVTDWTRGSEGVPLPFPRRCVLCGESLDDRGRVTAWSSSSSGADVHEECVAAKIAYLNRDNDPDGAE